jgi:hypothetical protein
VNFSSASCPDAMHSGLATLVNAFMVIPSPIADID